MSPLKEIPQEMTEESPLKGLRGIEEPSTPDENDSSSNTTQYYVTYSDDDDSNLSLAYSDHSKDVIQSQRHSIIKVLFCILTASLVAVVLLHSSNIQFFSGDQDNTLSSRSNATNATSVEKDTEKSSNTTASGPYKLVERQEGTTFLDFYRFYEGADSLGSAGFNTYVSKEDAVKLGIIGVSNDPQTNEELFFMKSSATLEGPRSSIRIEGKKSFDRGLFILDLRHMPNGDGVWPAFWLTVSIKKLFLFVFIFSS